MPPIPPQVAANDIILASWGNAVRTALQATLGRITQAGQLLVGSSTDDITALNPPSAESVLRSSSSGAISWLAAGALDAATWLDTRSITRNQIANGTIRNAQIGGRTITGAKLATNTITDAELADAVTDEIDDAADYRTNLAAQLRPTSPSGFSVGTQVLYLALAPPETTEFTPGEAGAGLAVHGTTLAVLAISASKVTQYRINDDSTLTEIGERTTGLPSFTRGMTYYNGFYYAVFANTAARFVADPLGTDSETFAFTGQTQPAGITSTATQFLVYNRGAGDCASVRP